jgi:putative FmdB family regulatory protein
MPLYRFSCETCGKEFDKILSSSDISLVTCGGCGSRDIKRVLPTGNSLLGKGQNQIPAGALSGGSCKSGFS